MYCVSIEIQCNDNNSSNKTRQDSPLPFKDSIPSVVSNRQLSAFHGWAVAVSLPWVLGLGPLAKVSTWVSSTSHFSCLVQKCCIFVTCWFNCSCKFFEKRSIHSSHNNQEPCGAMFRENDIPFLFEFATVLTLEESKSSYRAPFFLFSFNLELH